MASFDEYIDRLRAAWEHSERPEFLGVVTLDRDSHGAEVVFIGNTTSLRRLVLIGLNRLLPDVITMADECPCDRCRQNPRLAEACLLGPARRSGGGPQLMVWRDPEPMPIDLCWTVAAVIERTVSGVAGHCKPVTPIGDEPSEAIFPEVYHV